MSALRARLRPTTYYAKRLFSQTETRTKCVAISNVTVKEQIDLSLSRLTFRSYSAATEQKQSETLKGSSEKREFQAETRMLLDIVFIRELISNASDALEKFRYLSFSGAADAPSLDEVDRSLEIRLSTDKQNRTITFQDTGIGMTKEELTDNLGTIARSGSKSFIEEIKKQGADQAGSIIGQFGVGFYSSFMVAEKIEVFTRSNIIIKYSNFIGSPIYLNDEQPLWLMEPKEVTQEQHIEFYRFISNSYDKPRFTLHYKTDAPLSIRSILYVPEGKPGLFEMSRDSDVGVALYSRKILIKSKTENLLPKWLRFVKGVVDSEDIPLNLSRELLQNSALIAKLRSVLTNRFLKFMVEMSNKDSVGYDAFYKEYSLFMKEGITSLSEYSARQKDDQKAIFYLAAPSRELAQSSPYYESLKKQDVEVLFCYEMYDELVLLELKQFGGRPLTSVENDMQKDAADSADNIIGLHPIIKKLHKLLSSDKELANMVAQQLFSNAMVTAGLIMDARNLITGINDLLVKALEKH
ncbi:Hsp90-related protein TRAP1 [Operophtera brumata]|uniref:Hsp90-related protein TRAP1 n=1 Tax=Operophtera brumata TaxID=104452 RepID=A0A0L7LE74_OPEBR|nr:Hsp90-related protein TRAP1 [Operophtera brumata]